MSYLILEQKLFFFIIVNVLLSCFCESLYKVENETHIYCIDEEESSTIFILPPIEKLVENSSFLQVEWSKDWTRKDATNLPISPVLDKRWNGMFLKY